MEGCQSIHVITSYGGHCCIQQLLHTMHACVWPCHIWRPLAPPSSSLKIAAWLTLQRIICNVQHIYTFKWEPELVNAYMYTHLNPCIVYAWAFICAHKSYRCKAHYICICDVIRVELLAGSSCGSRALFSLWPGRLTEKHTAEIEWLFCGWNPKVSRLQLTDCYVKWVRVIIFCICCCILLYTQIFSLV